MDTILVVDSCPVVTFGLSTLLHQAGLKNVVEQAHTTQQAIHILQAITGKLALLMMDPALPDSTPDMFVVMARRKYPDVPILFFGDPGHGLHLSLAQVLGVNGYLDKTSDVSTTVAAIRMVLSGMQCFPRPDRYPATNAAVLRKLSSRELAILQLLRQGLRNKDIAERLYLSPKTVSSHKRNLLHKLGVNDIVASYLDDVPIDVRQTCVTDESEDA